MLKRFQILAGLLFVGCSTVSLSEAQSAAPEPAAVNAVSQTSFPGSAWVTSGYLSPLETGNLITTYAFEQGITLAKLGPHSLVPYASLTVTQDFEGFDWNNKSVSQIALKYSRAFRSGIVQAGGGYAYEQRFRSSIGMGQPFGFANYWFGWNPDARRGRSREPLSSFPGASWAAVGNYAPAEQNNVIANVYVQQGITVASFSRFSVIPFVEHTLTVDSAGHSWNNRRVFGEGLKLRVPIGKGVFETAAIYKHERRWRDGQAADGLTASVNLWYGWTPSKTHKEK